MAATPTSPPSERPADSGVEAVLLGVRDCIRSSTLPGASGLADASARLEQALLRVFLAHVKGPVVLRWLVDCDAAQRAFSFCSEVQTLCPSGSRVLKCIAAASEVTTDRGRLRAFLRICLNDGSLSEYMGALFSNPELVRQYYKRDSPLRSQSVCNRLVRAFLALEHGGVVLRLCEHDASLDLIEAPGSPAGTDGESAGSTASPTGGSASPPPPAAPAPAAPAPAPVRLPRASAPTPPVAAPGPAAHAPSFPASAFSPRRAAAPPPAAPPPAVPPPASKQYSLLSAAAGAPASGSVEGPASAPPEVEKAPGGLADRPPKPPVVPRLLLSLALQAHAQASAAGAGAAGVSPPQRVPALQRGPASPLSDEDEGEGEAALDALPDLPPLPPPAAPLPAPAEPPRPPPASSGGGSAAPSSYTSSGTPESPGSGGPGPSSPPPLGAGLPRGLRRTASGALAPQSPSPLPPGDLPPAAAPPRSGRTPEAQPASPPASPPASERAVTPPLVLRGASLVPRLPSPRLAPAAAVARSQSAPLARTLSASGILRALRLTATPASEPAPEDASSSSSGLSESEDEEGSDGAPEAGAEEDGRPASQQSGPMSARSGSSGASRPGTPPYAALGGRLLEAIVLLENYAAAPTPPRAAAAAAAPDAKPPPPPPEAPPPTPRGKGDAPSAAPSAPLTPRASPREEPASALRLSIHEPGKAAKNAQCPACSALLRYSAFGGPSGSRPARFCHYYGAWYCRGCSRDDRRALPSFAVMRWDFAPRSVCYAAAAALDAAFAEEVVDVAAANPALHHDVPAFREIRALRFGLYAMRDYVWACPRSDALLRAATERGPHLIARPNDYTMRDLVEAHAGTLAGRLASLREALAAHITRSCQSCHARGFICELCGDPAPIFPFQEAVCQCPGCFAYCHAACAERRDLSLPAACPKCCRLARARIARTLAAPPRAQPAPVRPSL